MTDREKLIALIQAAVNGCASYWAGLIADHLIANGVTVQRWIPVTERLPRIDETILVYDGDVDVGIFCEGAFQAFDENGYPFEISGVTHWMPLPERPKEGE